MTSFYDAIAHYKASSCALERRYLKTIWDNVDRAQGQLFQDCFVLAVLGDRRAGTFCEFGATDGKWLSNTYMLEKDYGWSGIVAEPARCWHDDLWRNRPNAAKDMRCVWRRSGETLDFVETTEAEFSTLSDLVSSDHHAARRAHSPTHYAVESVSLPDLLDAHGYGPDLDFLSIDTEGSEVEILRDFDFENYNIRVICVEHNMSVKERELDRILEAAHYRRCLDAWSRWDAWYVHASVGDA